MIKFNTYSKTDLCEPAVDSKNKTNGRVDSLVTAHFSCRDYSK